MVLTVFVISIFIFLFLGVPVSFSIMLTMGVLVVLTNVTTFAIVPTFLWMGVNNFALMAIPFFILAGEIMNAGDISKGLVDFCRALLGHIRAGLGYAAILACMLFACLSGAAVATVSAIGGIMLPILISEGYDAADSTAVVCAGSITGPIIPPSIPLVLYGVISGVSVTRLFIAGIIPGVICGVLVMVTWWLKNRNKNYPTLPRATTKELMGAVKSAFPALMMPVIMMGGMLIGIFTPTEAGVIAVVYAYLISKFVNRKMPFHVFKDCLVNAAKASSIILLVVAASQGLAVVITVARIPQVIASTLMSVSDNPLVLMCLINVFILIVGLFMDVIPALSIIGPIFLPIAINVGMDPLVFGLILVLGLVIGLVTPPVGNVLYIGIAVSKITLLELLKSIWPMVIALVIVLFLITFFPILITFLPDLIMPL